MPISGDIIGTIQYAEPNYGETLAEVGIRFDMGYNEMVRANPHLDPQNALRLGTKITIPSVYILPSGKREGLVINLAEYRLYYFSKDDNVVITFPVGIGRKGWETPIGKTKVTAKQLNPTWRPTERIRNQGTQDGIAVPIEFPAGPDNPLGQHVLRLGWPTYLIHGAAQANGVGMRVSAGCIRMTPNDIANLYELVATGTPVRIINESIKIGVLDRQLYIEVHPVLGDQPGEANLKKQAIKRLSQATDGQIPVTDARLKQIVARAEGIPVYLDG